MYMVVCFSSIVTHIHHTIIYMIGFIPYNRSVLEHSSGSYQAAEGQET